MIRLFGDRRLDGPRLIGRLRDLRRLEGVYGFSAALAVLTHLVRDEVEAERLLTSVIDHREQVRARLGRDPGLQVAALDYLTNVCPTLHNPVVVEAAHIVGTERSAVTDSLTDLYNRRYFRTALDVEIRRSRRYRLALSVLTLDLDEFKAVNDVYGHPFGDRVLRRVGRLIRRAVRESDVPCRIGGEEFAVVLPETDRLGAWAAGERVRTHVAGEFARSPVGDRIVALTLSGGVASLPEDGESAEALIERSDRALYRAKAGGRDQVVAFHAERRRAQRFPAREAAATFALPARGAEFPARPVDLGRGGIRLATSADCRPADPVRVTLGGEHPLAGRVVRVEGDAPARSVAVAFDEPISDDRVRRHAAAPRAHGRPRKGVR